MNFAATLAKWLSLLITECPTYDIYVYEGMIYMYISRLIISRLKEGLHLTWKILTTLPMRLIVVRWVRTFRLIVVRQVRTFRRRFLAISCWLILISSSRVSSSLLFLSLLLMSWFLFSCSPAPGWPSSPSSLPQQRHTPISKWSVNDFADSWENICAVFKAFIFISIFKIWQNNEICLRLWRWSKMICES